MPQEHDLSPEEALKHLRVLLETVTEETPGPLAFRTVEEALRIIEKAQPKKARRVARRGPV